MGLPNILKKGAHDCCWFIPPSEEQSIQNQERYFSTYFTPSKNTEQMRETQDSECVFRRCGVGNTSKHQQSCTETQQPTGPSRFSTLEKASAFSLPAGLRYYLIMI